MAIIIVEENSGPDVDYTNVATAVANANINDTVRVRGPWSSPDPGGAISNNKSGLTIEAVGDAATNGVVDEGSGTYWRLLYSGTSHAIISHANDFTLRGLTVKINHGNSDRYAVFGKTEILMEGCVIYGQSSSSAEDQHGLAFDLGRPSYDIEVKNCVFFNLRGSAIITEFGGSAAQVMGGTARILGNTFSHLRAGVSRVGVVDENEIGYYLHSNLFHDCTSLSAEDSAVVFGDLSRTYVDNCISDEGSVINASFTSNVNCLANQSILHQSPTSTGVLLEDRDSYPFNYNLFPATSGDNVAVDHHSSMIVFQGGVISTLLSAGIGGVLRNPTAVDVGAFELVTEAAGDITQDLPFFDQDAAGVVDVLTTSVDIDGPFIEQDLSGQALTRGFVDIDGPFIEQDAAGQVVISITGTAFDHILPFFEQDAVGTSESILDGDITQDLPFFEQDLVGAGFRIFLVDTTAPFIEIVAGSTTIATGNIVEDLPFVEQDATGTVFTVSQVIQDLPFFDQDASGDVIVQGDAIQDLPFIEQLLERLDIWSDANINSFAPFFDQDLLSTDDIIGNIDQDLPFFETADAPGNIAQILPFFEQSLVGEAARSTGDITQDLPFIEQDVIGGETPPIIGRVAMSLPFMASCGDLSAVRGVDINQVTPFFASAAVVEINVTGDVVQDLPFFDTSSSGAGGLSEDRLIRVVEHSIFVKPTSRVAVLVPARRHISVVPIERTAVFASKHTDLEASEAIVVAGQWIGGGVATWMDGTPVEYFVEE